MSMLRQALRLWKNERGRKGTTLQRRLIFFFISVSMLIILAFALLLLLFGIDGSGAKLINSYLDGELSHVSEAIYTDFGHLAIDGVALSEALSVAADEVFEANGISASELSKHPELIEPLLDAQIHTLSQAASTRTCGGAYVLLDATIDPLSQNAATAKSGMFVKKTQPVSTRSVGAKLYFLRGPALIARKNGIELMGQWHMEYDVTDEEFFTSVMETARANPELPLSRLYYWSGRVTLKGNSESGFMLIVPLRSADGCVFGVCGFEVSDRMFKSLYSPSAGYDGAFAIVAPERVDVFYASEGMIAGNYYLTGNRINKDLAHVKRRGAFERFTGDELSYGGMSVPLRLYPSGSPYEAESWSTAVLMPYELLESAAKGNSPYIALIVIILLVFSLTASIVISRRYLRPVTAALDSIREQTYSDGQSVPYLEINDLFDFLSQKDKEHELELARLEDERRKAQSASEQAREEALKGRQEVDPDSYARFLECLHTLTPRERQVFNLYLAGKSAKEILSLLGINENTLKYHNRNIYGKLGVSSRKQLLLYATLMKRDSGGNAD